MTKIQKFEIYIDPEYSKEEQRAIAKEVIDRIVERTQSGKDKNNEKFKKAYSTDYKKFKKAVGGKTSPVNLTLTGDMLEALELIRATNAGKLTIGIKDEEQRGKAEGNILGTYGKDTPNESLARDFMGISEKDLKAILKRYPLEKNKRAQSKTRAFVSELSEQLANSSTQAFETLFEDFDE